MSNDESGDLENDIRNLMLGHNIEEHEISHLELEREVIKNNVFCTCLWFQTYG